jgi:hypothetical protein
MTLSSFPTIVTMFYNIRKIETTNTTLNKNIIDYLELANQFILKLPYPLFIAIDNNDDEIENYILEKRKNMNSITYLYKEKLEMTYFYQYLEKIIQLQSIFNIYTINLTKDTPLYIILNSNKFHYMQKAIDMNIFNSSHFIWMDFGINHVAKNTEKIHDWILNVPDKIKQLCINPYIENNNPKEFFQYIYHHTAGGLFSGSSDNIKRYIELFKEKTIQIFNDNWYQLDEAIMTIVQRENKDLFNFYYGDYEGIISNYDEPIHSSYLIFCGLDKTINSNNIEFANNILNYLYPYIFKNDNTDEFYKFIEKNIIVNYYINDRKLKNNIITLINKKLINNDIKILEVLKMNKDNLNFYQNKNLIIQYD